MRGGDHEAVLTGGRRQGFKIRLPFYNGYFFGELAFLIKREGQ